MFEPAIHALQKAVELSQRTPVAVACLGEAYAASGNSDEARNLLHELTTQQHVTAYFVGRIYAALGDQNPSPRVVGSWVSGTQRMDDIAEG
jgi:hypothetical protein